VIEASRQTFLPSFYPQASGPVFFCQLAEQLILSESIAPCFVEVVHFHLHFVHALSY
jgi:hypothetical protein